MKNYPVQTIILDNDEVIAYRQTGKGTKVLLLIHGNMSSSVHFQELMSQLEDDYQVIALDLSGFGDSSYFISKDRLLLYADEVVNFIKKLGVEDVAVLGWSTGGGVALELAALLPETIRQVYLLNAVGVKGFTMYRKDDQMQPILSERLSTYEEIAEDPVQVLPILTAYANKDKAFLKMVLDNTLYINQKPDEETYDAYLEAILKQRNLVDIDVALVHFNMTDESNGVADGTGCIEKVTCPVTIIHGEADRVVPVSEAQQTKEYFGEQANLIVFPEAGHSLITDNLAGLVQAIRENDRKETN